MISKSFSPTSVDSDEDDSDAYIKPAKKTKPTTQASMADFLEKKPGASKAATKPASKTTARKVSGKTKAPVPKKMNSGRGIEPSDDDISLDDEPKSAPVGPRAAAPRRAAAAKAAYIELSDDDDD